MTGRRRLDRELVRRGLVDSRSEAQEAIDKGLVTIDGAPAWKAATQVSPGQALALDAPARPFVSRGGEKLAGALDHFAVDPAGRRCLDVGASTGGFTDCLLQRGAEHVVAVDVGYGQLDYGLRRDERVTVLERTNARELTPETLPGSPPELVVADLSFISLELVLPALRAVSDPGAEAVVLVKPQFEAERGQVGKGGVVRSPDVWMAALRKVSGAAAQLGWGTAGAAPSALVGSAGNVEFFLHLVADTDGPPDDRLLTAAVRDGAERGGQAASQSDGGARSG